MRIAAVSLLVLSTLFVPATSRAQQPAPEPVPTIEDIVGRIKNSEATLIANLRAWRPLIEVYIQNLEPNEELGFVPTQDTYFLGRFDWTDGPRMQTLASKNRAAGAMKVSGVEFLPDGFAAMAVPDWQLLDTVRYEFRLVRREFVGEARTFVLDVKPRGNQRDGFSGRIWVEDRGFNIVRFNGVNRRVERSLFRKKLPVHVDAWRVNVTPGVWVPSYVYCEEVSLREEKSKRTALFKGQVRLWGFDPQKALGGDQFTGIRVAEASVQDNVAQPKQLSPVLSQRRWEQEAEANVIERLEQAGLLGPVGEVEKILETVVNNLIVTSEIELETPVRARVLLTSPFESFTVGHTIVLSRGLIDVLPDESSLAMMVAHELSHIVLGHPLIDTQFAFADRMMVDDEVLLRTLKTNRDATQEAAADARLAEMLNKSPYKDKLTDAGLFLRVVAERARHLPNLIQPHIGDHLADGGQLSRLTALMQQAPELTPGRLDQIPALPLGARLVLDPWSSRLELSRAAAPPLKSVREKVPFAVTPLMPYLTYVKLEQTAGSR